MFKKVLLISALLSLFGCAGFYRGCSAWNAENFERNWIVVQYGVDGEPFNCWKLQGVAISNEPSSDGIYWLDPDGHLVHISGWYNRVQVENEMWESAASSVGVELNRCASGRYQ